ncbi:hypothetical protein LSAT2_030005 [Lamellibrachia satsuma]|nr:hypothetical protein LSAT2_030005 [Lamellibrachia satsuma]
MNQFVGTVDRQRNYFKKKACAMALNLLTDVYGLPQRHLLVCLQRGFFPLGCGTTCVRWERVGRVVRDLHYDHNHKR